MENTNQGLDIRHEISNLEARVLSLSVVDSDTYIEAGNMLAMLKDLERKIKDYFAPLKSQAHRAWRTLCDRESDELNKLTPALKHLNTEMVRWKTEQETLKREEEARLRREAERAEEERRLKAALEAEQAGDIVSAEEILAEPVIVPPPQAEMLTPPKIDGLTTRQTWDFEIVNPTLIPREYLIPDIIKIRGVVRSLRGETKIPGIRVFPVQRMVAKRR